MIIILRVSFLDCVEECIVRIGCLFFNYLWLVIFCELNYVSDFIEDEVFIDLVGWVYGRREYWFMVSVFINEIRNIDRILLVIFMYF